MRIRGRAALGVFSILVSCVMARVSAAPESPEEKACALLLPSIESLKTMLAQNARSTAGASGTERIQIITTLLGLRYHNVEALESSLRSVEAEENDVRGALARNQAQLESLDESTRNDTVQAPDPGRKAARAELDANAKGLDERARGLWARRTGIQSQLAFERRDIERLEAVVRGWIEKTP